MPLLTLAGTPNIRFPDPLVKRVSPLGLQPQSAFSAALFFYNAGSGIYDAVLASPPANFQLDLFLFGSDYPMIVGGTQTYLTSTFLSTSTAGTPVPNLITDITFPLLTILVASAAVPELPSVVNATAPVSYKEKLSGLTVTNNVSVVGFPRFNVVSSHSLYAQASGPTGGSPFASYSIDVLAIFNGAVLEGPTAYLDTSNLEIRLPVILWEPSFTQKMADDGYTLTVDGLGGTVIIDIVGLWASPQYSPSALPPVAMARSAASPPSEEVTENVIEQVLGPVPYFSSKA
jgi:hypothetical protein